MPEEIRIQVWDGTTVSDYVPQSSITGFAIPAKISQELAIFFSIPDDVYASRSAVTSAISRYVVEHDLQKEENRCVIDLQKPGGQALEDLLKTGGKELTFFNLQNYLKPHFGKSLKGLKKIQ